MKVMAQTKEFRTHTQRHRTAILGTLSSSHTANRLNKTCITHIVSYDFKNIKNTKFSTENPVLDKLYFDGLPAINWSNETITYKTSRAILL